MLNRIWIGTAAVALVINAGAASAQGVSAADATCRAGIQKSGSRLAVTAMKAVDGCIRQTLKKAVAGTVPTTDCNDLTVADSKGKVASTRTKTLASIPAECSALPDNIIAGTTNCPSPAHLDDAGGATAAIDSVGELADCEVTLNTKTIESLRRYILNPDYRGIAANPNRKLIAQCANAISKNATKLWATVAKENGACQHAKDKAGEPYDYKCLDPNNSKVADAVQRLDDNIAKFCGDQDGLTQGDRQVLGSCASSQTSEISNCVATAVKKNARGSTTVAYEFAGVCPSFVKFDINGGSAGYQRRSNTRLDLGWTGYVQDSDVVDSFSARVNLICTSGDCSDCTITANCAEGNCRCSNDSSVICNTPFVEDVCGAGNTCVVHFGPPLPLSAANTPTCIVNTIPTPFLGHADIGSGSTSTDIRQNSKVYSGISMFQPCPTCSAAKGATGVCSGGARNGLLCTSDATNVAFGNVSFDCPPSPGLNVSGAGLTIDLTLTDVGVSFPAADACDFPLGAKNCACGACTGDPTVACRTDSDCSGAGLGSCTNAGGSPRQPNACDDLTCTQCTENTCADAKAGNGVCMAGPTDHFCDGASVKKTNGEPLVTCNTNADCAAIGPQAGKCMAQRKRMCFLDPITATGIASTEGAELISTFCAGATTSAAINNAAGLPGPGRLHLDLDYTGLCADGVTPIELGGSNCTP